MKEEKIIRNRCGDKNPFRVPENYFNDFASQMMSKLPEKDDGTIYLKSRNNRAYRFRRPLLYAACILTLLVFSTFGYFYANVNSSQNRQNAANTITVKPNADELIDRTADYAMMDNHDIYACVSANE